jgi:hypothetical protein
MGRALRVNHAVIHIGPMKSGTSALARYLTVAQAQGVLPEGVIYPIGDLWFERTQNIVKQELELLQIGRAARSDFSEGTLTGIHREVDVAIAGVGAATRATGATAIFVCESAGKSTTRAALESWFAPYFDTVTFVTVARRQEFAMPSIIAQRVKEWKRREVSLDVADYLVSERGFVATLDYAAMMDQWATADRPLLVLPYLEGEQGTMESVARFFQFLHLGEPPVVRGIEGKRIHPTFSRDGLEALAALKRRAHALRWVPGYSARAELAFHALWKQYHAAAVSGGIEPTGRKFAPFTLTDEERSIVRQHFSDSNTQLLKKIDRTGMETAWSRWQETPGN